MTWAKFGKLSRRWLAYPKILHPNPVGPVFWDTDRCSGTRTGVLGHSTFLTGYEHAAVSELT